MQTDTSSTRRAMPALLFGFFVMGFVDLVGVATSYVKDDFALSHTMANTLPMLVFAWFAIFSIPTGLWMGRHGRRATVAISLCVTAVAMLLPLICYIFPVVLTAFALLGIGNTILQVSLNPMVAAVVRPERVASTLTLGQFIKAISSMLGPVIAGCVAAAWGDWKLIFPVYAVVSLISLAWLLFAVSPDGVSAGDGRQQTSLASVRRLLANKTILLLFCGILCTVGLDVGINTAIPKMMMERCGLPVHEAGFGTSLYFLARTVGALAGAFILARTKPGDFLKVTVAVTLAATSVLIFTDGLWALGTLIAVIGLMWANVFSIIFSFALAAAPDKSDEVSALMIMGVAGGALVPPLMGIAADAGGLALSLVPLWLCAAYVLRLAFLGARSGERGASS